MTEEWDSMQGDITYSFLQDGYFEQIEAQRNDERKEYNLSTIRRLCW